MKKISTILLTACVVISACMARRTQQMMDACMGQNKAYVIYNMGPPSSVSTDGQGGEVLVYATQSVVYTPPGGYPMGVPQHNRVYWNYKMFYVNNQGIVYHWKTDRCEIPPQQMILYVK